MDATQAHSTFPTSILYIIKCHGADTHATTETMPQRRLARKEHVNLFKQQPLRLNNLKPDLGNLLHEAISLGYPMSLLSVSARAFAQEAHAAPPPLTAVAPGQAFGCGPSGGTIELPPIDLAPKPKAPGMPQLQQGVNFQIDYNMMAQVARRGVKRPERVDATMTLATFCGKRQCVGETQQEQQQQQQ